MKHSDKYGFSLVELAIVITVIAVIISMVTVSINISRQARLRVIIKEVEEFRAAITHFEERYLFLPGDFPDINDYWTDRDTNIPAGDGDWHISTAESRDVAPQLAATGLLDQTFRQNDDDFFIKSRGDIQSNDNSDNQRNNIMPSILGGGGYWFHYNTAEAGNIITLPTYTQTRQNVIDLAARTDADTIDSAIIHTDMAFFLDRKFDDAMPNTGEILGITGNGSSEECIIDGGGPSTLEDAVDPYNRGSTEQEYCIIRFQLERE